MRALIVLAFLVGVIFLQIILSKRENRFLGLILPIISFLFALLFPLNMAAVDGVNVAFVFNMSLVFCFANIPTFILLGIYFSCREKLKIRNVRN